MEDQFNQKIIKDRGGMRSGTERRRQNNSDHRSGSDRRSGRDRRSGFDRRAGSGRQRDPQKGAVERRDVFRK